MAVNLTHSMQDYLKTIFMLTADHTRVPTTRIAQTLNVQPASVTSMIKKLADCHLVDHQSYHGVALTESGRTAALEMIRHHRLLETYLSTALGYDWADVHEEADRLEHYISEEFEDRIASLLGNPLYDPHGDPIPGRDGVLPPTPWPCLLDVPAPATVTIRRVDSSHRDALVFLSSKGITIGTTCTVLKTASSYIMIDVSSTHKTVRLPNAIVQRLFVDQI
jgi:DtxR family transcriptional regulator, Mn-dependent transcriptional regulator